MRAWLETLAVVILALLATLLGLRVSKLRKSHCILASAVPLSLIILVACVRRSSSLRFVPPFSFAAAGRNEFVIFSAAIPAAFAALIPRLRGQRQKILVSVFALAASLYFIVSPFLVPALLRGGLAKLQTQITVDGLCLQSTSYTCGPAAAVTALNQLGINAEEGEIAILAHSTPIHGTHDDLLAQAIRKRYTPQGITCDYRLFDCVAQLKRTCPTIAVIKFAPLVDHYVTVLEVSDTQVVAADPLAGKQKWTYGEFADRWRFIGIVVERNKN